MDKLPAGKSRLIRKQQEDEDVDYDEVDFTPENKHMFKSRDRGRSASTCLEALDADLCLRFAFAFPDSSHPLRRTISIIMDYQQHAMSRQRQMEAEMSRFESEIGGGNPFAGGHPGQGPRLEGLPSSYEPLPHPPQQQSGGPSFQFIPHAIQRNLPQRPGQPAAQAPPQFNQQQHHPHQQGYGQSAHGSSGQASAAAGSASGVGYTVTPMGLPPVASQSTAVAPAAKKAKAPEESNRQKKKNKKNARIAGGQVWEDASLQDWDNNDFRIFCGDLGNDVTDEVLNRAFNKYPSFLKSKVVRDKRTNKTKGFGFVSFKDPQDFMRAMRDMNGKYVGSRPIKLRKSSWKDRNLEVVKKKKKERAKLGLL